MSQDRSRNELNTERPLVLKLNDNGFFLGTAQQDVSSSAGHRCKENSLAEFKRAVSNPKARFEALHLGSLENREENFFSLVQTVLNGLRRQISVKEFFFASTARHPEDDLMRILPFLIPGKLENICLDVSVTSASMDEVIQTEQFKKAKDFSITSTTGECVVNIPMKDLVHLRFFDLALQTLTLDDVKLMIKGAQQQEGEFFSYTVKTKPFDVDDEIQKYISQNLRSRSSVYKVPATRGIAFDLSYWKGIIIKNNSAFYAQLGIIN